MYVTGYIYIQKVRQIDVVRTDRFETVSGLVSFVARRVIPDPLHLQTSTTQR